MDSEKLRGNVPDFMFQIRTLPGFVGFYGDNDNLFYTEFHYPNFRLTFHKELPENYAPHNLYCNPLHDFWEELFEAINPQIQAIVASYSESES